MKILNDSGFCGQSTRLQVPDCFAKMDEQFFSYMLSGCDQLSILEPIKHMQTSLEWETFRNISSMGIGILFTSSEHGLVVRAV